MNSRSVWLRGRAEGDELWEVATGAFVFVLFFFAYAA